MYKQLKGSLKEAIKYHKKGGELQTHDLVIPDPPKQLKTEDIVKLRTSLRVSQSMFSKILNVSVKTVQAWEAGRRQPAQSALRLLEIVKQHPEYILQKTSS